MMSVIGALAATVCVLLATGTLQNWFVKSVLERNRVGGEHLAVTLSDSPMVVSGPVGDLRYELEGDLVLRLPQNAWEGDARWHVDGLERGEGEPLFVDVDWTHDFSGVPETAGIDLWYDAGGAQEGATAHDPELGVLFVMRHHRLAFELLASSSGRRVFEDLPPAEVLDQLILLQPSELEDAHQVEQTLEAFTRASMRSMLLNRAPAEAGPARRFTSDRVSGWVIGSADGATPIAFYFVDPDWSSVGSILFDVQPHLSAADVASIVAGLDIQRAP